MFLRAPEVLALLYCRGRSSRKGYASRLLNRIESDAFDYVNLHWYYISQNNAPALDAAFEKDLGVFIISPTDKGGHLHTPSKRMIDLCSPLHPIVFNDLFCLRDKRVHTISVGAAMLRDSFTAFANSEAPPSTLTPLTPKASASFIKSGL